MRRNPAPVSGKCGRRDPFPRPRKLGSEGLLEHAAADLVLFDRLEQGAEIPLAEALVAFALDDLEEDRADDRRREDLQQHLALSRRAVEQDAVAAQALAVLPVPGQ